MNELYTLATKLRLLPSWGESARTASSKAWIVTSPSSARAGQLLTSKGKAVLAQVVLLPDVAYSY